MILVRFLFTLVVKSLSVFCQSIKQFIEKHKQRNSKLLKCDLILEQCVSGVRKAEMALTTALKKNNKQGHREFPFWKLKIPPPAYCENSRKFPL